MSLPLIQFRNVVKSFNGKPVLQGIDLDIFEGEITAVVGKSGEGKTVFLKHVIGLLEPDDGKVLYQGRSIAAMTRTERKKMKRKFSYLFQNMALFDSISVYDNIALPLKERHTFSKEEIKSRVNEKIGFLDLDDIGGKYPSQLSGGMKKRVALARAMVTDPEIILFDEPTTGLDPVRKNAVHSMIADYHQRFGFTAVVISHEVPDIFYISQRVIMIDHGRVIYQGSPEDIEKSTEPVIKDFIKGMEIRHDALTGMAPKTQAERRIKEEITRVQDTPDIFSLILMTIYIGGEHKGPLAHEADQKILKTFASHIKKHLRRIDICARYGLNKIVIILPQIKKEQAEVICSNLARDVEKDYTLETQPYPDFSFSVSSGVVEVSEDQPIDRLIQEVETNQETLCEWTFHGQSPTPDK